MKQAFSNYQPKVKKSPHRLAYDAQRLCDQIKIPFSTVMLKAIKMDKYIAESTVSYMKEKHIYSINYFTKVFYARYKEANQRGI